MAGQKAKITESKYHPNAGKGACAFFYDSEEGTVLGRTAGSWIKIIVFYIIYYICLAGFFTLNYYIFSRTLNEKSPKWMLDESLIGSNPGIGFRPLPDRDTNADSTLIWYRSNDERDSKFWYSQLETYMKSVDVPVGPGQVDCSYGGITASESASCRINVTEFDKSECSAREKFGYPDGKPCVLIKLNKIYGWEPEPFGIVDKKFDAKQLDEDLEAQADIGMPDKLRQYIKDKVRDHPNKESLLKTVWMSCDGENVGDKENLPAGYIKLLPLDGIPGYYFPYLNQKSYKSPFIFAKLDVPASSKHTLINIECRAWAKNIKYDRPNRLGSVHFEIMVD